MSWMSSRQLAILFFPQDIILRTLFPKSSSLVTFIDGCRNLKLQRKVVESPSLEIFKTRLDVVLCSLLWVTLLWQEGRTR